MTNTAFIKLDPIDTLPEQTSLVDGHLLFTPVGSTQMYRMSLDTFTLLSQSVKILKLTDPAPTVDGLYRPESVGTYSNTGGLVAKNGYDTIFLRKGGVWSKSEFPYPQTTKSIPQFADLQFPVTNTATEKVQCVKDFVFYQLVDGQTATVSDIPGVSAKWVALGSNINFKTLNAATWNGENSSLELTADLDLTLDTTLTFGSLEVKKDYYSRHNLSINGKKIKLPFGNCLISFVKVDTFFNFYVSEYSQKSKEYIPASTPLRNKVFTGIAGDVVTSNDAKFNLTQFSVGFSVKISANKFVAISKGTSSTRNWDVVLTNYNTGGAIDLQFNIGASYIHTLTGNSLDTFINVIATFNGSTGVLYRNGTSVASGAATLTAGGNLMIGQIINLYSTGEIKDLFICNRALTSTEVTEYNSSSDKSPLSKTFASSVVEYFNFGSTSSSLSPEIVYTVPSFSIYKDPILMRNSRNWNSGDIANPDLTIDEKKLSGYKYILQYSAYGTTDLDSSPKWRTALAFSNDFKNPDSWIVGTNFCFEPASNEGYIAANGSIVIKDGWFYFFYQTGNSGDVASTQIRAARSKDLKTWNRLNSGNPVIQRTQSYESAGAYDPMTRLNEDGLFEMVYTTYNGSQSGVGYATSSDGINWSNKKLVIGLNNNGSSEPCICKVGDKFFISCDLYNGAVRNCYGAFWDGVTPIISSGMTKIVDGVDAWNSVSCFDSYCFLKDDSIYCFFAGGVTTSNNQGIEAQIGFSKAELIYS